MLDARDARKTRRTTLIRRVGRQHRRADAIHASLVIFNRTWTSYLVQSGVFIAKVEILECR